MPYYISEYRTFAEFHLRLDVWYTEVDILNCTRLVFFSSVSRPASSNRSSSHSVCPHSLHEMHKICKWTLFKLCKFMLNCLSCPLCPGTDSQLPASPPIIALHVHPVLCSNYRCVSVRNCYTNHRRARPAVPIKPSVDGRIMKTEVVVPFLLIFLSLRKLN